MSPWIQAIPKKGTPNSGGYREGVGYYYDENGDMKITYVGFDANGDWMGPIDEAFKAPNYHEIADGSVFYDPQTQRKLVWKSGVGYQDAGEAETVAFGSD